MDERRANPRHRVLKAGLIFFNNTSSTIDCTLRNQSDGGALLKVASPIGIPDQFTLQLLDKSTRQCRIAWRGPAEIGVALV